MFLFFVLLNIFDLFNHVPHRKPFCNNAKIPFLSIINCRNEDKTSWSHKLDTLNPKRLKYITQSINITSPLRITFEPFVDLPMGLQDNAGGIINNTIISVGGFCGGGFLWKEPYCCGKRGFLKTTYAMDLSVGSWKTLDSFPGIARQGHKCTTAYDELYCWGGFSYVPAPDSMSLKKLINTKKQNPYGYNDGYKLNKYFKWEKLASLPSFQGTFTNICYIKDAIYLVGGSDYDLNQFHTVSYRTGEKKEVGKMAWKYYIKNNTWAQLANLPGTGRMNHATICINNKVYVIGGSTSGTSLVGGTTTFKSVKDNWYYDINKNTWHPIKDTPYPLGNWGITNIVYKQFIILVGGTGYSNKHPSNPFNYRRSYSNAIVVYDTIKDDFYYTDPLPMNINLPLVLIKNDTMYIIGGEGGSGCVFNKMYGQHLNLVLKAKIKL